VALLACASVAAVGPTAASAAGVDPTPCAGEVSNPFLPWGDSDGYRLAPDGDFSSAPSQWELGNGAELVESDSPLSGGTALELEKKESALTAPICMDGTEPHSRLLSTSTSGRSTNVLVRAVLESGHEIPVQLVRSGSDWDVSSRIAVPSFLAYAGQDSFQYRFTAIGKGTTVIDDLYIDPRARH
jgi:hypothetical protein